MSLVITVETRWTEDTSIARCRGRVLYGPTSRYLRTAIARLILRHRRVVLDLSGVTHLDAAGLGTLAALIRLAQWSGGRLELTMPSVRVRYLLALTRLDTRIEYVTLEHFYDPYERALRSLFVDLPAPPAAWSEPPQVAPVARGSEGVSKCCPPAALS